MRISSSAHGIKEGEQYLAHWSHFSLRAHEWTCRLSIRSLAIGTCFGAKLKHCQIISRWSDLVELLQPPIGLNESLILVELLQPPISLSESLVFREPRMCPPLCGADPAAIRV